MISKYKQTPAQISFPIFDKKTNCLVRLANKLNYSVLYILNGTLYVLFVGGLQLAYISLRIVKIISANVLPAIILLLRRTM